MFDPNYKGLTKRQYGKSISQKIQLLTKRGMSYSDALKVATKTTPKLQKRPLVT